MLFETLRDSVIPQIRLIWCLKRIWADSGFIISSSWGTFVCFCISCNQLRFQQEAIPFAVASASVWWTSRQHHVTTPVPHDRTPPFHMIEYHVTTPVPHDQTPPFHMIKYHVTTPVPHDRTPRDHPVPHDRAVTVTYLRNVKYSMRM